MTKDDDFDRLVTLRGFTPKLIRLTLGNASNEQALKVLLDAADALKSINHDLNIGIIELG